ncbi:Ig-like domain-containing protein [Reichenbachiella sp. 5M10]|uniref:Ig-like domain-containing protein n=1 Tax=Reichenbachiella sp. 5M10 TaxID=1889772 RepID=UPI001304143F|nr:Ig-like domain-containing protein [Reichenbachiella sp. 5M10]
MKDECLQKWRRSAVSRIVGLVCLTLLSFGAYAQSDGLPRGAYQMPYTRYESEEASYGGGSTLHQAHDFDQNKMASEASNQEYVGLPSNGAYVQFAMTETGRGVTMRFTMPDNESTGEGHNGSLDVYVNGSFAQTVDLTSRYAWQYFRKGEDKCYQIKAGTDKTRMRFDEVHFLLSSNVNPGDVIRIQKGNGDSFEYGVDFIEVEPVDAPKPAPANSLSVVDFGATGNDTTDDLAAFHACLDAADAAGQNVYIPAGKYYLSAKLNFNVNNLIFQGAGMWHTELFFSTDLQFSGGIYARASNVVISDFFLHTINNDRWNYEEPFPEGSIGEYKTYKGFMGTYGSNSTFENIWVEHFECGAWIAGYDAPLPVDITDHLTMKKMRIRNNYADGVNFCQGTNNSVVEHSSVRNNGDDGLAVWPNNAIGVNTPGSNNTFRYNTIENQWRAGGTALFGASGHSVHHSIYKDGFASSAIRLTTDFSGYKFDINTGINIYENTIIHFGTSDDLWDCERGAIELNATNGGIRNVTFENIDIIESQRHAIQIGSGGGYDNVEFHNINVNGTGHDDQTQSCFAVPLEGAAIFAYATGGTVDFYDLSYSNVELDPAVYKTSQGLNLNLVTEGPISVNGVDLEEGPVDLLVGQSADLMPSISPSNATNKAVTWSSSNPAVATVDANTQSIMGLATGSTVITVTTDDGGHTDQVTVNVTAAVNIEATDADAAESGDAGEFTISISDISQNISVGYTVSGTATSGSDYSATPSLSGTVTLSPSNPAQTISIAAIDDSEFEGNETVTLTLQAGSGYQLGGTTAATITISDNENPPCTGAVIGLTASAPANDANIEASWNEVPITSIANANVGSLPGDYAGQWRAMYDEQALYVLVEVQDSDLNNDSGSEWWNDDVVNVFIDGNNSKGNSYDGINDFQLGYRWNDATVHLGGNSVQNASGVTHTMFATAGGYTLKTAIPWSTIGVTPNVGQQIGIDIAVDDDDNGGTREAQMSSFATTEMGWAQPALFGSVYLTTCAEIVPTTPIITSPLSITRKDGEAINYKITASHFPDTYSATDLPAGITLNTSTGQLSGTLTGVGTTSVTISASNSAGSDTETLEIIVNPEPATGVTLSATTVNLTIPNTQQLTATIAPAGATNQNVAWSTSDAAIATVDASGLVTAVASGSATITATTADGGHTATAAVTVVAPGEMPPVANPGGSQSVVLPSNSATLDGSASSDPDGTIVAYAWAQTSGPNTASLSGASTAILSVSNLIEGLYIFELTVTDDNGISASETASINVTAQPVIPADRGYYDAPYTRFESEAGNIGGGAAVNGPTYDMALLASEATDRQFVSLSGAGSYVEWTMTGSSWDGLTLRYSIPDNTSGTLALYVNGSKVRDIALSSYWAWQYFDISPSTQGVPANQAQGPNYEARMRFDELHFILDQAVNAGDVIRLQKDSNDGVAYGVDFIEMETVPAAIPAPAGYLNVMDYGATPNDETNDAYAFRQALDIANGDPSIQGIYIPAGRFINGQGNGSPSGNLFVANDGLAIQGAGMWHTELYFSTTAQNGAGFLFDANNIQLSDLYMNSATNSRTAGNKAINGSLGSNSTITNVWAEHFETGFWISSMNNGGWNITDGLVVSNCRIRNVYADGVNLAKGTSNTVIEHTSFRNCIDDAMATWSVNYLESVPSSASQGNIFRYSTVENNLRAAGLGFFGGHSHEAHHLLIKDGFAGPGIRLNTQFPAFPFGADASQSIDIYDVTVIGSGTTKNIWTYRFGAIELELPSPTQGQGYSLQYVNFSNIDVIDSQHDAVFIHSYMATQNNFVIDNITFNNVNIDGTGVALDVNNGPNYTTGEGEDGGHGIYVANFSSNNTFDGWLEFNGGSFANIAGEDVAYYNNNGDFEVLFGGTTAVTGVTVNPSTVTLEAGETQQLSATVAPTAASDKNVTWTTSDAAIATVSNTGVVTAHADGSAVITVTTNDGGFTAATQVTVSTVVVAVTGVTVSPTSVTIDEGASQQLTASVAPANANDQSVTWSTSNAAVVTVSVSGQVYGVRAGTATITVTTTDGGFTATTAVTVEEVIVPTQSPYSGSPISLPGTVEVENFDLGGEGIAYHDTNAANEGGQYRTSEGVDVEVASGGGYNIGWTSAGEWLEYTVDVQSAGTYDFEFRVASINAGGTFHVEFGGADVTGTVTSANTGAWQTWTSVYANDVTLSAGQQIMRIALDNPNHNLDKVIITSAGSGTVDVTGVSVSPASISLTAGATQQLAASVSPANASNTSVTWTTSDAAVASVTNGGLVTAISAGTATITATTADGGFTATSAVTVTGGGGTATGYRIKNVWSNDYLYDGGANVNYGSSPVGDSYVWQLEDVGGGNVEIKNASTGEYMHIENLTGSVQSTTRTSGWYSSRWAIEDAGNGESRIRNAWQSSHYIHVENLTGSAQHGTIYTAWASAKWVLEPVGGARILEDRETALAVGQVQVYPNPVTNGNLHIDLGLTFEQSNIRVMDLSGHVVFTQTYSDHQDIQISTRDWVKGLYLIQVEAGGSTAVRKVSIQ